MKIPQMLKNTVSQIWYFSNICIVIIGIVLIGSTILPTLLNLDNTKHVIIDGAYIIRAKGNQILLINNQNATDASYNEVINFIKLDSTDNIIYNTQSFVCADFAEKLHNNAESKDIKCAYVSITFQNEIQSHALNAFNTTDKGLIFIDCTGHQKIIPCSADKIANVKIRKPITYKSITNCNGYYNPVLQINNTVKTITITW